MSCWPSIGIAREHRYPCRRPSPRQPGLELAVRCPLCLWPSWRQVDGGRAGRYQRDVCPFGAWRTPGTRRPGSALADLLEGQSVFLIIDADEVPGGWEVIADDTRGADGRDPGSSPPATRELVPLHPADVPEMLALVERTRPGPFLPRTIEMGTYLGLRSARLAHRHGRGEAPPGRLDGDQRGVHRCGVPGSGARHPPGAGRRLPRSGLAMNGPSSTPPPPTRRPSGSTSPWGSSCAARVSFLSVRKRAGYDRGRHQ